jgi:hypothetical protein
MAPLPRSSGASRLFHTIVVLGAFGTGCGGSAAQGVDEGDPEATDTGGKAGTGGAVSVGGTVGVGGSASSTGGIVGVGGANTGGTPSVGGANGGKNGGSETVQSPDECLEWDDWRCVDETTLYCVCDPSQPDEQADCDAGRYLVFEMPYERICVPPAAGPEDCSYPAQYAPSPYGEAYVCNPYAPLREEDCTNGGFSCLSYDPPTQCHCYVGILK